MLSIDIKPTGATLRLKALAVGDLFLEPSDGSAYIRVDATTALISGVQPGHLLALRLSDAFLGSMHETTRVLYLRQVNTLVVEQEDILKPEGE